MKSRRVEEFTEGLDDIISGYRFFLKHQEHLNQRDSKVTIEKVYESLILHYSEDTADFKDFFENVNLRISSEAICETIGSIMNGHLSEGRNLRPQNLKEIFLRFTMPPFHIYL